MSSFQGQGKIEIESLPLRPQDKLFLEVKEWWLKQLILSMGIPDRILIRSKSGGLLTDELAPTSGP